MDVKDGGDSVGNGVAASDGEAVTVREGVISGVAVGGGEPATISNFQMTL